MKKEIMEILEGLEKQANCYTDEILQKKKCIEYLPEKNYSLNTYLHMLKDYTNDIEAYQQYLVRLQESINIIKKLAISIREKEIYDKVDELENLINKYI